MALSTREGHDAPKQKDTHNVGKQGDEKHDTPSVGKQGAAPAAPATTLEPTLVEGLDKVLLHRLYPEADTIADAGAMALAQGRKTRDEGEKLIAAQQG
jgi:hypothetical protein